MNNCSRRCFMVPTCPDPYVQADMLESPREDIAAITSWHGID